MFELTDSNGSKPADVFTGGAQAGYQLGALGVTLIFALVGGVVTGFIIKIPIWGKQRGQFKWGGGYCEGYLTLAGIKRKVNFLGFFDGVFWLVLCALFFVY